jgi:colicin import membrane protein
MRQPRFDAIVIISLLLSAVLHGAVLYLIVNQPEEPGASDIPSAAITVSLAHSDILESLEDKGTAQSAAGGVIGQGGTAQPNEPIPEEAKPDPAAEARLAAEEEARRKAEPEARDKAEAEAREKAEAEAREKAEVEARLKAEAETNERVEAEARLKAEAEAQEKAQAEARRKAEAEAREKAEAEAREAAETERRKVAEAEARKRAAEQAEERAEAERERRAEEREKTEEERRKRRQARAPGTATRGNSEAQTGRASASQGSMLDYKARVRARVQRIQVGGSSGRGTHRLSVKFYLSEGGGVVWARISNSSGNPAIDQAVLSAIRGASFPPAPSGMRAKDREITSPLIINNR